MQIAPNYLAIERAVVECAYAGCETIWIVCNDDMQPLIRHRLGDYVSDPIWAVRPKDLNPSDSYKHIPIFYVPVHPNDRDKRDCLAWSVIYGAASAYNVSLRISKWVTPDRYYTAFPYGVYAPEVLREHRTEISSKEGFFLSNKGKTVKEGEYLGFTFNSEDFIKMRRDLRKKATALYISPEDNSIPKERLPVEKRYSGRYFSLEDVFNSMPVNNSKIVDLEYYHRVDNWDGYCNYISSENRKSLKRPPKYILNYHEWNLIGFDCEE